jgi:GntR family transcriptional regulator, transcriptional repressor for pyruvate dehydrogenase complex
VKSTKRAAAESPSGARASAPRGHGSPWRPISRVRTYELVLDRIEEQILEGQLQVGSRLPAERDLAAMLGVSRTAVREAMRTLEALGVVHAVVGTGPESGTTVGSASSEALTRLLQLHVALANFPVSDVVEARVMLERWSVHLAVRHAGEEDLLRIRDLVEAMDDPGVSREEFNNLDTAFHVAIAEAGGNRLVRDITTAIRESLRSSLLSVFNEMEDWDAVADGLRAEHRAVYDLLVERKPEAVADVMERHIRGFAELQERRAELLRATEHAS